AGGLDGRGEIQRDAGAEKHRQPQDAAVGFGGKSFGQCREWPPAPLRCRAEPVTPAGKIRRQLRHGRRTSRVVRDWSKGFIAQRCIRGYAQICPSPVSWRSPSGTLTPQAGRGFAAAPPSSLPPPAGRGLG